MTISPAQQSPAQTPLQLPTQSPVQSPMQSPPMKMVTQTPTQSVVQSPPMKQAAHGALHIMVVSQPMTLIQRIINVIKHQPLHHTSHAKHGGGGGAQPQYHGAAWTAENHTGGDLSGGTLPGGYSGAQSSGEPGGFSNAAQGIAAARRMETSRDVAFGMNAQSNDRYGKVGGTSGHGAHGGSVHQSPASHVGDGRNGSSR